MTRLRNFAVGLVSRAPARVQTKLLVAFLAMVALLILLGAVGLRVLSGMNERTEELIELQRKIAAYRQVQHDTTRQLYGVSNALLSQDERALDGVLRQLSQFGYDLDRLQYVEQGEVDLLARVRQDYDRFIEIVTKAVEHARAGQIAEARELQLSQARPLADRLERLTNELVNVAEADMLERIEASQQAYEVSRRVVVGLALGSIVLALGLGYVFSWSLIGPVTEIEARLRQIAAGDFSQRAQVVNRDELGALAANVNRTSEELGRLYQQIEERAQELREALERQTATSEVLSVISRSTSELQPVLDAIVATAARLCEAEWATIRKLESDGKYHLAASSATEGEFIRYLAQNPIVPGRGTITGRTALEGRTVHVPDVLEDPEFTWFGAQAKGKQRTVLGVPLMRANAVIGVIVLLRNIVRPFTEKQIELVTTFADQAVIAIENVRLFDEVNARTTELTEALERQTATSDVLTVISRSTSELQPVLDTIVTTAARLCHAEWATVYKLEAAGVYRLAAAIGDDEEFLHYLSQRPIIPERGTMAGRTALEGRTLHVPDILEDPDYTWSEAQAKGRYRTLLGVPLLRAGAVIGVIVLARNIVKPFTEKQIELVTTFADQAVIAIENVRLFDEVNARTTELTEALERQTATSDVLTVISRSTSELQPVLDAIVVTAVRLCHAEWATIWKLESDGNYHLAASSATDEEFMRYLAQNPIVPGRGTAAGRTALEGRTVHIPDLLEDPEFTWFEAQAKGKQRTVLCVPLLRGNAVIGVIALMRNIVKPFTEKQIELVTTFADQAVIAIENVRLFDEVNARTAELTEALERQTATSDVLTVISRSTFELQPVLDAIVATAVRLCHAEWAVIFKLEADGRYHLAGATGSDAEFLRYLSQTPVVPGRGTAAGRTVVEGRTLHLPDVLQDPEYVWHEAQAKGGYRTVLCVPLLRGELVIGVVTLARNVVRPFTEKQIELVTTFADQAVIAIENVRLFDEVNARTAELTESLRQQTATADVLKIISRSAFDLEAVLHTLIASAARLCDADKAVITRQIGGRFYDAEACGFSPEFMEYVRNIPVEPDRGSAAGRALLEGKVVHIADVEADPEYTFLEGKKLGGFRTVLGVPMLRQGIPIGVMSLTRSDVRPFTDRQIELVSTFADQAVIAIENVRLFDEVQARTRELTRSVAELRALSEVSQAVNSTLELGAVLNAIAAHAVALAEADAGAFSAYDESARVFRFQAIHELDPDVVETFTRRPVRLGDGALGRAGQERRAIQIADIDQDASYALHDVIRKPGYRALLAVPLLREDSLVGGLVLLRKTPGAFSGETVELVQTLANQSVLAIENARLFEALEQKGRELAEASRHKSEFLANISHELRTPLNAIIGFTRLVMRRAKDVLPAKQHDNLGKILTSAEHLLSLINAVLDLAKIEAGRIEVRPSTFALEPLIDQCLRTVEPMAREGVRLAKALEPDLPELDTDQEKLRQVLLNLLGNAAKFTDSGSISVGARHRDGQIVLEVADTGCGIPPESLDLIFEEFRQVDSSSTRQHGGTGLGLSISRHLARLIGGDIDLASTVDVGSTFTLTFPARYEPPAAAPSLAASEAAGEVARTDRNRCILAIDDDPDTIYLLRENLTEAGYDVIVASDGEDGLRKARQHRPGAVVLDILMPQKDGWQILHELKADPATRDIPIIVLSIVDQKDLGFRLGASDYLLKPPDRDALIGALRRVAAPPCRLLVADDDPLVPDLIRQLLEDLGCEIEAAGDGRAALAMLAKRRPDVLLLDLLMPNLDGFGVLEQLAQNPALAGLPVIVLTAKTLTSDERALLQRRVLAIIEKRGLDRATLLEEVRRALPACGGAREAEGSTDAEDPDRGRRGAEPRPARAAS